MSDVYAMILAGGSGSRFWPASRRLRPKQLLAIAPGSELPLITLTARRLAALWGNEAVLVATGAHLLDATRAALSDLPASQFFGEPQAKNTAPCIAWLAHWVARKNPEAVVAVIPSDQHIALPDAYAATLEHAKNCAKDGSIVTIGLKPTRAETGYGYIETGEKTGNDCFAVARFVEKPDAITATEYMNSGRYLWNSGMFFFKASVMVEAIKTHQPKLSAALSAVDAAALISAEAEAEAVRDLFENCESISIDYAVMEHEKNLKVVPGEFGWSDLGSWQASYELSEKDASQNSLSLGTLTSQSQGCLLRDLRLSKSEKLYALVGVEGLTVVDTDDALLVMKTSESQDVKSIVEALKQQKRTDLI